MPDQATAVSYAPTPGMSAADIAATVEAILAAATVEEKVAMMSGKGFFAQLKEDNGVWGARPYRAGALCERLGVPALYFTDGPRGVARGQSTCFPVTMARGASFDVDLERRIGEVMGIEARAQGCNLSGAVCVNLLRHPAWGRAQETYGEDPYHLGEMGAALAVGIQTHKVIATVKHLALNSIENARFKIDVMVDPRTLREVYLPHFKRILDAGCMSVMSAYNKMNGEYCGQNRELLTDILRHEWGFEGFVHSDWVMGVREPFGAAAGLDIENPEPIHFGKKLVAAVESGAIGPETLDTACRRILTVLYTFAAAEPPLAHYDETLVASPAHRALAHEAAVKSAVLLKNAGALPLAGGTGAIAVSGRLADMVNTGDNGSSRVRAPEVITPFAGLSAHFGNQVSLVGDEADPAAAAAASAGADAAIVVVGYTAVEEGEYIPGDLTLGQDIQDAVGDTYATRRRDQGLSIGGDRTSLRLPDDQVALIRAVAAANPKTIVIVVAGSAVIMTEWLEAPAAVLQTFYAGMEGGRALTDLLTGAQSPSGKLPFTVARDEADYPFFDKDADSIVYGPWHGYALFEREAVRPLFPFGFGLSYAAFSYRALSARRTAAGLEAEVSVRNDGAVEAESVVQLYLGPPGRVIERARKLLRGFQRVRLAPGETKTLRFFVPNDGLTFWRLETRAWTLEPGPHRIHVGGDCADADSRFVTVEL